MFANLLRYAGFRYLWWALASVAAAWALYASHSGSEPPNGGTWQGYVLGTWAAILMVWLTLLGYRKRRYRSALGTTQGWASAHVYLGVAVWAIATLHSGFQVGANVHTAAYVLLTIVVLSGLVGLRNYLDFPRRMADNRGGRSRADLFAELHQLNTEGIDLARRCAAEVHTSVRSSIERTRIGGGVLAQLSGRDGSTFETLTGAVTANTDQAAVIDLVSDRITRADRRTEVTQLQDLLAVLCRRQSVLRRLREDIRLDGWLNAWLYVHVPVTFAALAALIAHIVSTFIYW
jgi:hypothetical protein